MKKIKKNLNIFNYNIDLIQLISGTLVFLSMLLYGLLKIAFDVRGVTLIFGRGYIAPQWFAIMTFSVSLIFGIFLVSSILIKDKIKRKEAIDLYAFSIFSILLLIIGIITFASAELLDKNILNKPKSLDVGAIISGILFLFAGLLLFLRYDLEIIDKALKKIKRKEKKKTVSDLVLEIEKLGTLVVNGIEISKNDKAIIDIINLYWNYRQLTLNIDIPDALKAKLSRENDRMIRYIKNLNLEVNDYQNRVYNNMNLDILSIEVNNDLKERIIIKTIEPEIRHNNIIIQRSKVILAGPEIMVEG